MWARRILRGDSRLTLRRTLDRTIANYDVSVFFSDLPTPHEQDS